MEFCGWGRGFCVIFVTSGTYLLIGLFVDIESLWSVSYVLLMEHICYKDFLWLDFGVEI